ncbi:uncharacterized protein CBL_08328 [Carabus blaptoides fortunei]
MDKLLFVSCLTTLICLVQCKTLISVNALTTGERPEVTRRQARQWGGSVFKEAAQCGFDMACFLDVTENDLRQQKQLMMIEADTQFIKTNLARGVATEKPSDVANTVEGIITEMTDIIQDTVTGWFRDGKDDEPEESEEKNTVEQDESAEDADSEEEQSVQTAEDDDDDEEESHENDGEARGKKKKKRKALIKLLILGAVLKAKITLLLQLFTAALQVKFFLIALAGLIVNKIRLWYDLKKGHQPQKVIYYEHAQHQHHYDHGEEEHGGLWGRAYEVAKEDGEDAQDMAYKGQRPIPWSSQQQH